MMTAAGMVNRVRQEVDIHSKLSHPSILQLYVYFEDNDFVYLVLELCEIGEFQRYLKALGHPLDEDQAREVMSQLLEGMLYLHSHNILHRDLSLANLLLTKEMKIVRNYFFFLPSGSIFKMCYVFKKIADFGLATQLSRPDEKHMTMCGTPNYISPEVSKFSNHPVIVCYQLHSSLGCYTQFTWSCSRCLGSWLFVVYTFSWATTFWHRCCEIDFDTRCDGWLQGTFSIL